MLQTLPSELPSFLHTNPASWSMMCLLNCLFGSTGSIHRPWNHCSYTNSHHPLLSESWLSLSDKLLPSESPDIISDGPFQTVLDIITNGPLLARFLYFWCQSFSLLAVCGDQAQGKSKALLPWLRVGRERNCELFISVEPRHADQYEAENSDWWWHFL